ncbi:MAG: amino acid deaminase/aldolase [Candidatus Hodarchaeales archaeon]|jgi:D-serine deaminase-like pyridoxal phosphate-dependent protein
MNQKYENYNEIFVNTPKPLAYVDLDLLNNNIEDVLLRAQGKPVRIASKSVRSVELLKRIFDKSPKFQGIMSYSALEAVHLLENNFNNILIAYPIVSEQLIELLIPYIHQKKDIYFMIDCIEHLELYDRIGIKNDVKFELCLDIDMSSKFFFLHFGVFRSGISNKELALNVANKIQELNNVNLAGLMGYEAQIAGLPDFSPANNILMNWIIRLLKKRSINKLRKLRSEVFHSLKNAGFDLEFINGGGTGSVESTREEKIVTEITVGSAFFSPKLFDYYQAFRHLPASGFAIEITRNPKKSIYTCHGGGYVASGSHGIDKLPIPYLPDKCKLVSNEGAGEVQTPIQYKGNLDLKIGDSIFFRHAKAGELCEHFNELHIISNNSLIETVKTYRGEGKKFL